VISATTTRTTQTKPTLHERTLCDTPREGTAPPHTAAPRPEPESTTSRDCSTIAACRVNPVARRSAEDAWQLVGHPAWHPLRHPAIYPGEPRELRGTRFEAALRTYAPTPIDSKARRKERAGVHEGVGAFQREKVKRRTSGEESQGKKVGGRKSATRRIEVRREVRRAPRDAR
jgi:hypothetical protein